MTRALGVYVSGSRAMVVLTGAIPIACMGEVIAPVDKE